MAKAPAASAAPGIPPGAIGSIERGRRLPDACVRRYRLAAFEQLTPTARNRPIRTFESSTSCSRG